MFCHASVSSRAHLLEGIMCLLFLILILKDFCTSNHSSFLSSLGALVFVFINYFENYMLLKCSISQLKQKKQLHTFDQKTKKCFGLKLQETKWDCLLWWLCLWTLDQRVHSSSPSFFLIWHQKVDCVTADGELLTAWLNVLSSSFKYLLEVMLGGHSSSPGTEAVGKLGVASLLISLLPPVTARRKKHVKTVVSSTFP